MFWTKKKPLQQYKCIAPNYVQLVYDEEGDCLDKLKETLYNGFEQTLFTKEEIALKCRELNLDLWQAFIWVDHSKWIENSDQRRNQTHVERLVDFLPALSEETSEQILQHLNFENFYHKVELEIVANNLGVDVIGLCEWQGYVKTEITMKDDHLLYYMKR